MKYVGMTLLVYSFLIFNSCISGRELKPEVSNALFKRLGKDQTNIDFINKLSFDSEFNIYTYRNFYNGGGVALGDIRSEEHTSELQSHSDLVCRLLLEKKKTDLDHLVDV